MEKKKSANSHKHLDPVDLMCHESPLPCWGVKRVKIFWVRFGCQTVHNEKKLETCLIEVSWTREIRAMLLMKAEALAYAIG